MFDREPKKLNLNTLIVRSIATTTFASSVGMMIIANSEFQQTNHELEKNYDWTYANRSQRAFLHINSAINSLCDAYLEIPLGDNLLRIPVSQSNPEIAERSLINAQVNLVGTNNRALYLMIDQIDPISKTIDNSQNCQEKKNQLSEINGVILEETQKTLTVIPESLISRMRQSTTRRATAILSTSSFLFLLVLEVLYGKLRSKLELMYREDK